MNADKEQIPMLDDLYFSEREHGVPEATKEELGERFWGGFVALINGRMGTGAFAQNFPINCPDSQLPVGADAESLGAALEGNVPGVFWPLQKIPMPATESIVDAVEFFGKHVAKVGRRKRHSSDADAYEHDHLEDFQRGLGFMEYRTEVNRLFRSGEHPYELDENGQVRRTGPAVLREALSKPLPTSGDEEVDRLLTTAREKFLNPSLAMRKEGLEKLWDAWERLKTITDGEGKKARVERLLEEAIPSQELRERINAEARELTSIGNNFMIRHTETDKLPLARSVEVDYLFHRLFALILLLIRGRQDAGE